MINLLNADAMRIPLKAGSAALVVTSPPYWDARPEYSTWPSYAAYLSDMALVWAECFRILCDGGRIAVNVPATYGRPGARAGWPECLPIGADTTLAVRAAGFTLRGEVVWSKKGMNAGTAWGTWKSARCPSMVDVHEIIIIAHKGDVSRGPGHDTISAADFLDARESVWNIRPLAHQENWHPAPFPDEIPRRLIELYSFAGDIVCDPFSGSGTTVKVAHALGRTGIGVELDWKYARRSMRELSALNGNYDLSRSLSHAHARPLDNADLPMFAVENK